MSNNLDVINNFDKSIVKIIVDDGRDIGTGFVVTDDGIICTCYHVIGDLESEKVYDNIQVYFPQTKQTISATILKENGNKERCFDPTNDIAFLKLFEDEQKELKKKGEELTPLPLSGE